jgi:hypothetical protein
MPASTASAQVDGWQHAPALHVIPPSQPVPQLIFAPHAFVAVPHVAAPQTGAGQVSHVPATHCVPLGHALHVTLPLPQAFAT